GPDGGAALVEDAAGAGGVDLLVRVEGDDAAPGELHGLALVGADAAHRHEPAGDDGAAAEDAAGVVEGHGLLGTADLEGRDEPAALGELVPPGGREVPGAHGDDEPVVRRARRVAGLAVGLDDAHPAAAVGVEG